MPRSPPLSYGDGWITENPLGPSIHYVKLGKKGRESSKRNYYIISPRVVIKAIMIISLWIINDIYMSSIILNDVYMSFWILNDINMSSMLFNDVFLIHGHSHQAHGGQAATIRASLHCFRLCDTQFPPPVTLLHILVYSAPGVWAVTIIMAHIFTIHWGLLNPKPKDLNLVPIVTGGFRTFCY